MSQALKVIKNRATFLGYSLPGVRGQDKIAIPLSGGADSTALCIVLLFLFPWLKDEAVFIFTDTEAECGGVYESLDALEQFLGIEIVRVRHPEGLAGLIDKYNGFLPSSLARWCTKSLKIQPFEKFMKGLIPEGGKVYAMIGIRYDEQTRLGLFSKDERIVTETPYRDLKIGRDEVYQVLSETIGVPSFYRNRTRSGCAACWGMRTSEVVSSLFWAPQDFLFGKSVEKLTPADLKRYEEKALRLSRELGVGENHLGYPRPPNWEAEQHRGRRTSDGALGTVDMFSTQTVDVFVGVEFMVNPGVGGDGVWWQELVSFSTSRSGINRQLASHYYHRLKTAEVKGLTPAEVAAETKLVVYQVELPADKVFVRGPQEDDSYTWRQGWAYAQIEHVVSWVLRTLQAEGLHQEIRQLVGSTPGTYWHERYCGLVVSAKELREECGRVVTLEVFEPPQEEPEEEEHEVTCIACSF